MQSILLGLDDILIMALYCLNTNSISNLEIRQFIKNLRNVSQDNNINIKIKPFDHNSLKINEYFNGYIIGESGIYVYELKSVITRNDLECLLAVYPAYILDILINCDLSYNINRFNEGDYIKKF